MATISRIGVRGVVSGPRPTERAVGVRAWRLKATQTARVLENPPTRNAAVDIPVTCYQVIYFVQIGVCSRKMLIWFVYLLRFWLSTLLKLTLGLVN